MKKMAIILWCLILVNDIDAQEQKILSSDSLLKMFKVITPFEVFEKVQFARFDFKSYYNSTLLKSYLMKWLDKKEYYEYLLDKEKQTITNSPELIKREILYKLNKQGQAKAIDSILMNPKLYTQYRDSAISIYINRYIKDYNGEHKIPDMAIVLHSVFAYPESYTIIKQWWDESGRETERSNYFIPLVRLEDPDARRLYADKIKKFVKTNGTSSELGEVFAELTELNNSYSIEKMIELFGVSQMYYLGPDGEPYNCRILSNLVDLIFYNSIATDPSVKRNAPCKEHLKHLPEIKTAAQKLIEKYKTEELYWMKNMPYYKKGTGN